MSSSLLYVELTSQSCYNSDLLPFLLILRVRGFAPGVHEDGLRGLPQANLGSRKATVNATVLTAAHFRWLPS